MFFHNDVNFINNLDQSDNYDKYWSNPVLIRIFKKVFFGRSSEDNIYLHHFCLFTDHGVCNITFRCGVWCQN